VSLCYVDDLVEGLRRAATADGARGETYFVAHEEVWEWRGVAQEAAAALGVKTFPVRVPKAVLFGAATLAELAATFSGGVATLTRERARVMWEELWVCDVTKAKLELDFVPRTGFAAGAKLTTAWYREQGWL
jgi:nucleoside-diphosphate-sugar epimerase